MKKQTVYLPVNGDGLRVTKGGYDTYDIVEKQHGYFFTPEQLNEYTQSVIKQALGTAAEKVELVPHDVDIDLESITNTFEETYKKFEV